MVHPTPGGLRYVLIVAHPRTGGTWLGKLLDACDNVKFLWEADLALMRNGDTIFDWQDIEFRDRVMDFKPHVPIEPEFDKGVIDTAVVKLVTVTGYVAVRAYREPISLAEFVRLRSKLNATVLHLVRHPVRWAASTQRWGWKTDNHMKGAVDFYTDTTLRFHEEHRTHAWYRLVSHDALTQDTERELAGVLDFCGLARSPATAEFLAVTHAKDGDPDPHKHSTTMTRETVLNRWRTGITGDVARYADRLTAERWGELYQPLASKGDL